ncbi:MAG: hypothetical protein K2L67_03425 [Clostridia bacterium]|nr:hypothetical protein [Clostridia bacterium]
MAEKSRLLVHRLIWGILLIIAAFISFLFWSGNLDVTDEVAFVILIYIILTFDSVTLVFFIASLLLTCKIYDYNGDEIIVYAGWYHHYIKVNGEKADEHNTIFTYTAINMSCTLDDGAEVWATISMTNRISLKINNRLYNRVKK